MSSENPTPEEQEILDNFLYLREAYAAGKADKKHPLSMVEIRLVDLGCLIRLLDNSALVSVACEAAGAVMGWDAAIKATADRLGPSPAIEQYREAMTKYNPYRDDARLYMDLAVTSKEHQ